MIVARCVDVFSHVGCYWFIDVCCASLVFVCDCCSRSHVLVCVVFVVCRVCCAWFVVCLLLFDIGCLLLFGVVCWIMRDACCLRIVLCFVLVGCVACVVCGLSLALPWTLFVVCCLGACCCV